MRYHGSPKSSDSYIPTGKIWPSGEFSFGYRKVASDRGTRVEVNPLEQMYYDGALVLPDGWSVGRYGVPKPPSAPKPAGWAVAGLEAERFWVAPWCEGDSPAPLDLTSARNSHKPTNRPESYGRQGMTGYGRKMIRSACALLETRYKGRLTFATVTMPALAPEARIELAECWPEFVRQALQWLSRRLEAQGLPKVVASVSEIQPGRLRAGNGGYLHLHMVWPNQKARAGCWAIDVKEFRAWVEKFLLRRGLLPDGAWANVDTQRVEKSASAYLSKYMSKGGDVLAEFVAENGWSACPGQWWNLTKAARDWVKSELVSGDSVGAVLESVVEYAFAACDFRWLWSLRHVDMAYDGRLITVGWTGILKDWCYKDLMALCRPVC